jgi:hypothetical protein
MIPEFIAQPITKDSLDIPPLCEGCFHLATPQTPLYAIRHQGKDFLVCHACLGMLLSPEKGWKKA